MRSIYFFIDFTLFIVLGLMAGLDWMVAFSVATFVALMTQCLQGGLSGKPAEARVRRHPNHRGLPAFRHEDDWSERKNRRR